MNGKMEKEFRLMKLRGNGYKQLIEDLELFIQDTVDYKDELREKLENYNKDSEIQKLQDEINEMRINSIHIMSDKEREDAREFSKIHQKSCKSNIKYILEGTGVGTGIDVKCKKCGTEKNITDYDNW